MSFAVLEIPKDSTAINLKGSNSMTIYYLCLKTHNITGLRYLCQTKKKDPISYFGSGKEWTAHLHRFGFDIRTNILLQTSNKEELVSSGRYYSTLWNITAAVDDFGNKIYANLIPETCGGGFCYIDPKINKDIVQKKSNTVRKNYGVDWPMQDKSIMEKSKKTMLQKYGVEHVSQNKASMDRIRNTNKAKGDRPIVHEIRNLRNKLGRDRINKLGLGLSGGWYQFSEEKLNDMLKNHLLVIAESFKSRKS